MRRPSSAGRTAGNARRYRRGRRAEQGVGDGVEHDIGIAVAGQAAVVRDGDPAEHHRAVAGKGMDVEAHAGAR